MDFELYAKHKPQGQWLIVVIGIGLIILFASVTPEFQLGEKDDPVDPAFEVALAQATEILELAEGRTIEEAFDYDSDLVIEEYRILDQTSETRFEISILGARRGERGTVIRVLLDLDVEENRLKAIDFTDPDER